MAVSIRCGRLVDVEAGEVLRDQLVVVRDGLITSVRPYRDPPPDDVAVLDLSGATVVPGLIDCHTHLISVAGCGDFVQELKESEAEITLHGVAAARDTLRSGFTTVRDVGTFRGFVDIALRDAIEAGVVEGPRMVCAGAYVTVSGGGGMITGLAPDVVLPPTFRSGQVKTVDDVRERVREIMQRGADLIKVIATGAVMAGGTVPGAPELTEEQIRAAVEEAAWYGGHVAAHAHGAEGIKRAVRAGVRSIEHACYLDDEGIELMLAHGTYLVADIWWGDWITARGREQGWDDEAMRKADETTEVQREAFARAVKAGVKIAFGSDAGGFPHGIQARQLATHVRYGQSPIEALRSATLTSAELLGWADRVGSVAAGKHADLVAVAGDGSADVSLFERVDVVMKGGELVIGAAAATGGALAAP